MWKLECLGHSDKPKPTVSGPYRITQVFTNGTVAIRLSNLVVERINIRRIVPDLQVIPEECECPLHADPQPDPIGASAVSW